MDRKYSVFITWIICSWMLFSVHSLGPKCPKKKVITYNTALLDMPLLKQIPNTRIERRYAISDELRRLNADVVCLQEVWVGDDVEFLTKTLTDVYPFSFSKIHVHGQVRPQKVPRPPPCNYVVAMNFIGCITANKCLRKGLTNQEMYLCTVSACYFPYVLLSQKCISCVVSGFTGPSQVFAKCVGAGVPMIPGIPMLGNRDMNEPGLILLSKSPLFNTKFTDFHPTTKEAIERGYLEADSPGLGKLVCTHMTNSNPIYYEPELWVNGVHNSYAEQGASERGQIIEKFAHVSPLLLMGDFNVGDRFGPWINPILPKEFRYMVLVFDIIPLKQCTLCSPVTNPYVEAVRNTVVDHIFFKGHKVTGVVRVFDPLQAILLSGLPLSDHYGVMALIDMC